MLRYGFLIIVVATVFAEAASAQTACDPNTFVERCEEANLVVCDNETDPQNPVEFSFACTQAQPDATCGAIGCAGACDDVTVGCVATTACNGLIAFNDDDQTNNFLLLCPADQTCAAVVNAAGDALVDQCTPHAGPACAAGDTGDATCTGSVASFCIPLDDAGAGVLTSNIAIDCAVLGLGCGPQPCECDENCGQGGACVNGECNNGVFCQFAIDDLPACPAEGEGEGEGEGEEDECSDDGDCEEGEVCNRGTCEDGGEGGGTCAHMSASTGAPLLGMLALLGLVPFVRRRRQ